MTTLTASMVRRWLIPIQVYNRWNHLWRGLVSGTGDADRSGAGRLSLGQADLLRRAMGKKKAEEMAKVRERFCTARVSMISRKRRTKFST